MTTAEACPFCGSNEVECGLPGDNLTGLVVICLECGARGPLAMGRERAVKRWNDRLASIRRPGIEYPTVGPPTAESPRTSTN